MDELRSMLGWISVHWRAQKQQRLHKMRRQKLSQDNIYSEATVCAPLTEVNELCQTWAGPCSEAGYLVLTSQFAR